MTKCVALYCRISKDASGRVEGVRAQERWGRAYAARNWPDLPVRVFADNDLTAADASVRRPEYEALRAALASGDVEQVWTVEQSRLERTEVGWFQLAAELDAAGIPEVHTNRDGIVRVRDEVAGIKAVLAAAEVRKLKRRINDRLAELAAEGRPSGSTVFGYRRGLDAGGGKTLLVVEAEAAVIRDTADKVLAGWSLSRIAEELRREGWHGPHRRKVRDEHGEVIVGPDGPLTRPSTITATTVQSWLTNPTVAGHRVHQGQVVGRGVWEPILDEATWRAVRGRLSAPRVVERSDGGTYALTGAARTTARRYMLTGGTAVCGVCDRPLIASMKQLRNRQPQPYYLCHPRTGGRGCVGIMAEWLETYVVDEMLNELDKPAFRQALAVDEHSARRGGLDAEMEAIEQQRKDLAQMWAARELTAPEWRAARQGLTDREGHIRREQAALPPAVEHVDPALIRAGWGAMNLDERREILGMFVARVVVKRARPGQRGFDDGRVDIEWVRHAARA